MTCYILESRPSKYVATKASMSTLGHLSPSSSFVHVSQTFFTVYIFTKILLHTRDTLLPDINQEIFICLTFSQQAIKNAVKNFDIGIIYIRK